MHRAVSAVTLVVLLALHFDVWWADPRPADDVLPGLPAELGFRLAWMGLAWLWLLHFTARVWRTDEANAG
ncbi:MAG: hypothetical protein ACF8XB_09490 [Planctomycetota bacterium JB042]